MSGIKQHFIDWLYIEIQKKDRAVRQARTWQPVHTCCLHCHQPLLVECHYCSSCGRAQTAQATDELIWGAHIDTAMILACRLPGERPLVTYLRLRGLKKIMQEDG